MNEDERSAMGSLGAQPGQRIVPRLLRRPRWHSRRNKAARNPRTLKPSWLCAAR
jgi:hypothetical protein